MSKSPEANNPSLTPSLTSDQLMELARMVALIQSQSNQGSGLPSSFIQKLTDRFEKEDNQKEEERLKELELRRQMGLEAKQKLENEKYNQMACGHRKDNGTTALVGQKIGENDELMMFACQRCFARFQGPIQGPYTNEHGIQFDSTLRPPANMVGL
jgi:hypothetical protein